MDIWRGIKLVKAQPILFFFASILAFVCAMVAPQFSAKEKLIYKSSAKVLITPTTTSVSLAGERQSGTIRSWFADEATLRTLLSSQDLLELVTSAAGVTTNGSDFRDRIQLEILSNAGQNQVNLLEISVLATKPEEARVLSLTLSEKFIQYIQQLSAAEQDKTVAFLERERRNAEREVAKSQKRLLKLGILPRVAGPDPVEESWVRTQEKRNDLERDLAMAQAEVEQLQITGETSDASGAKNPFADSVSQEQLKLAELREVYTEKSPQVKAQKAKVDRLVQMLAQDSSVRVAAQLEASSRKVEKFESLLRDANRRLKQLESSRPSAEKHLAYANEERQLTMWQENYLDLTRQLYRARVMQQSSRREGAFTIVEKPLAGRLVSGRVGGKSPVTLALMSLPLSLAFGLATVMALDYFSASLRVSTRIEEALGLPVIGRIPCQPPLLVSDWEALKGSIGKKPSHSAPPRV